MQRQRLTITLDNDLLAALDSQVDHDTLRNRSHAIEHFLKEGLGLYRLRQAFLFFDQAWTQPQLEQLLSLLGRSSVTELFLCLSSQDQAVSQEIQAVIADTGRRTPSAAFIVQVVPSDFGSGAAVLLQKARLENPFLLCHFGPTFALPASLLQPYLFHREHRSVLTVLLGSTDGLTYRHTGLSIAQPELTQFIPAGMSGLQESVFPALAKEGKVRGYALPILT